MAVVGRYFPYKTSEISAKRIVKKSAPQIFISTDPADVNPLHLRELYSHCNYSPYRFPIRDSDGRVDSVEVNKLHVALSHSTVVVSVFTKPQFDSYSSPTPENSKVIGVEGDWFQRFIPLSPATGELVGFGRAVSDYGLTASIYDLMVMPTLQRRGIGRMIIQRIIRLLTSRGIYDIAALCSGEERQIFEACGFENDIMGSTTMMYTRTSSNPQPSQMVQAAGRKLLLVPPRREPFQSI